MTTPPSNLERLWRIPVDPCNVQLGGIVTGFVLALQPLPRVINLILVIGLVVLGVWYEQIYEKQHHMDDTRTGIEFDNYRDVLIGAVSLAIIAWVRNLL